ncbi:MULTISPECIES: rhodanese-like domain-containing protein [Alphaproteobacteria]|uniref:Rhodanese n=2 Tax=Alphaproteobacteria TaxID=28211 RepID=A0A512HFW1_9HYPH|nr:MULTISPECIES: rhodanese-like domain-containing protein [Alphaproteobacteria]GEO84338.1 rhodanese [Ciceribacter naphthalenivorans]GLR24875.1 rhodanese [Ciceribacter naphthalenivorans]GLT07731.1 rhodanese [Sphingomonas psychrolutea]
MRKGYKELLAEANAQVKAVEAEAAKPLCGRDGIVFVDLRDPREREREGSIPGAFSCPRGMLEFWVDPESPYAKPIFAEDKQFIFFCASGWRSALAAKTVEDMGMEGVSHLAGGFTAWKAAGGPVEEIHARHPARPVTD